MKVPIEEFREYYAEDQVDTDGVATKYLVDQMFVTAKNAKDHNIRNHKVRVFILKG